jgi:hypothetical protein
MPNSSAKRLISIKNKAEKYGKTISLNRLAAVDLLCPFSTYIKVH